MKPPLTLTGVATLQQYCGAPTVRKHGRRPDSPTSSVNCRSADCKFYPAFRRPAFIRSSAPLEAIMSTLRLLKFPQPAIPLALRAQLGEATSTLRQIALQSPVALDVV